MAGWLHESANGVILTLHIQPGAKRTDIAGLHGDALKIRLAAPPVDGKANDCLLCFLSERLDVPRSQINLVSGMASRSKRVRVDNLTQEQVLHLLTP